MNKLETIIVLCLRKLYQLQRISRLRCRASPPTVLSRDCTGGILFHDLGLQFRSPTVNLSIDPEDFILFCQHLPDFLKAEVEEAEERQDSWPVGRLVTEYGSVTLRFVHYTSFEQARDAWNRRRARVDLENLRLILHVPPAELNVQLLKDFEALPYEHKVLISSGIDCQAYPHGFNLPIYETGYRRSIERYLTPRSLKRHMDAFDWIPFLNGTWKPTH